MAMSAENSDPHFFKMENRWNFGANRALEGASLSIREVFKLLISNLNTDDNRTVVPLGHGDPSSFSSFRTDPAAEDAVCSAVRSAKFNGYSTAESVLGARRAIAKYLSRDLTFQVSPEDIYLTVGCLQGIEVITGVLARPGANILLPRPGFPAYEALAVFFKIETRHFDLLPEKDWEVDLDAVEALADENTAAIVIINPCNPCGNVFTSQHLRKIAETARRLGILVISDEVYDHFAFGNNPFVPMAKFSSIVPVVTLGAISKRWFVPGWRMGWLVTNDPDNILKDSGLVESLVSFHSTISDPATIIQGALPDILEKTGEGFFSEKLDIVRQCADVCYERIKEIPCFDCPHKPEGSMFVMVKLNLSLLENINDDMDFCCKLAKEESVIVLPGCAVGLKDWLRITFAVELESLKEGLCRIKSFCQRHAIKP